MVLLRAALVLLASLGGGLLAGVGPCYVFPLLGVPGRWCGFKSEPPHFVPLFLGGAALTFVGAVLLLRRRSARRGA